VVFGIFYPILVTHESPYKLVVKIDRVIHRVLSGRILGLKGKGMNSRQIAT